MKTITALRDLRVGDTVVVQNLLGRRLARVSSVSRAGFSVGRHQYHWDGRGRNHSDSVAVLPVEEEFASLRPIQSQLHFPAFGASPQRAIARFLRPVG